MITPTIGRIVWFTPQKRHDLKGDRLQPFAAIVVYVHDDRRVNLAAWDQDGNPCRYVDVTLVQDDDEKPEHRYAEWMPYRVAQAKKHEGSDRNRIEE